MQNGSIPHITHKELDKIFGMNLSDVPYPGDPPKPKLHTIEVDGEALKILNSTKKWLDEYERPATYSDVIKYWQERRTFEHLATLDSDMDKIMGRK